MPTPRDRWAKGPWDNEPDLKQWVDKATGLPCEVKRGPLGAWNGYVGVPPGHAAYGLSYSGYELYDYDVNDNVKWWRENITHRAQYKIANIEVHGGLTYGGEGGSSKHFAPDHYWFGFDCAHAFDLIPGMTAYEGVIENKGDVYRTMVYAIAEVEKLARQLAAIKTFEEELNEPEGSSGEIGASQQGTG